MFIPFLHLFQPLVVMQRTMSRTVVAVVVLDPARWTVVTRAATTTWDAMTTDEGMTLGTDHVAEDPTVVPGRIPDPGTVIGIGGIVLGHLN